MLNEKLFSLLCASRGERSIIGTRSFFAKRKWCNKKSVSAPVPVHIAHVRAEIMRIRTDRPGCYWRRDRAWARCPACPEGRRTCTARLFLNRVFPVFAPSLSW